MTESVDSVSWKRGYQSKLKAEIAFREMEKIRGSNAGKLTAGLVVIKAKIKSSPLHKAFEWDDAVAAEEYRLEQARRMIRSLEVVHSKAPMVAPQRQYVTVTEPAVHNQPERIAYVGVTEALSDPVMRSEVLSRAIREAASYRRKYAALSELAEVFVAIDHTIEAIGGSLK